MWNKICCNKHWQRLDGRRACVWRNVLIDLIIPYPYTIFAMLLFFYFVYVWRPLLFFEFECVTCNLNFKKKNKVADTRISRQTMQAIMPPPYYVTYIHPYMHPSIIHTSSSVPQFWFPTSHCRLRILSPFVCGILLNHKDISVFVHFSPSLFDEKNPVYISIWKDFYSGEAPSVFFWIVVFF